MSDTTEGDLKTTACCKIKENKIYRSRKNPVLLLRYEYP
ncbi:MAG: hypothetical protein AVDCRST_MAG96-256 [uncultured Segetibacter sp.]|uniref:Uncharacterized protein n=1 Tax=uncultured Segetibacter sp. TaxID=481133 RepID=A0A6J4RG75_9BACT|nr:MAG: hypothetical protein AVDCRST_MAG96-256 [uncultured Segetibacter sp.]